MSIQKPPRVTKREILLRYAISETPLTKAMIAGVLSVAESTANNWLHEFRKKIRIVGYAPIKNVIAPVYLWGEGEDVPRPIPQSKRSQERKADEKKVAKKATKHKNFRGGEWDKSLFDMSQYRCVPNPWDAWLFDKRAA